MAENMSKSKINWYPKLHKSRQYFFTSIISLLLVFLLFPFCWSLTWYVNESVAYFAEILRELPKNLHYFYVANSAEKIKFIQFILLNRMSFNFSIFRYWKIILVWKMEFQKKKKKKKKKNQEVFVQESISKHINWLTRVS